MEYPLAEVLDRLTIETRKRLYGADNDALLSELRDEVRTSLSQKEGEVLLNVVSLALANADIANLEWQVREGRQLTFEELGRRAKKIREINDRRVAAKNALAQLFAQHSEARLFGYGEGLPAEGMTLEVQEGK